MKSWRNFSIANKFYLLIGTMGVLIAGELLILSFALETLSAVRAFVAVKAPGRSRKRTPLSRYSVTHDS